MIKVINDVMSKSSLWTTYHKSASRRDLEAPRKSIWSMFLFILGSTSVVQWSLWGYIYTFLKRLLWIKKTCLLFGSWNYKQIQKSCGSIYWQSTQKLIPYVQGKKEPNTTTLQDITSNQKMMSLNRIHL